MLQIEKVGIYDHFLDLGGDSLLAGQVITRVIRTLRVSLPLPELFSSPTVAEMALTVTQRKAEGVSAQEIEQLLEELEAMPASRN